MTEVPKIVTAVPEKMTDLWPTHGRPMASAKF